MPSPVNDRIFRLARRAALWMIGPAFLLSSGPLAGLASSVRCAAALELLSILVVRASPSLAIGSLFAFLHMAAVTFAFGVFAELAYRASGSLLIAAALTTALGISQPFGNAFSPPWTAAAFGACAAVALALYSLFQVTADSAAWRRSAIRVSAALVATAAIVPAWTVPCGVIAFATAWRGFATRSAVYRAATATAAAFVVAAPAMLVAKTVNATGPVPWSTCVWSASNPLDRMTALVAVIDASGPLVLALSALGAYAAACRAGVPRTSFGVGIVALATIWLLGTSLADRVVGLPILVAVWFMAAAGVREMYVTALNRRAVVSALLLAVVPLLQFSRSRIAERDWSAEAHGAKAEGFSGPKVAGVSLSQIRRLLNLVPDRATLVEEDASVDLLVRAAEFGRLPPKSLATVPATRRGVTAALERGRVYAFPLGQHELSLRGFAMDVAGLPADSHGLATVTSARSCVEITRTWVDLDSIGVDGRVSLVADAAHGVGPVVIYFSGENGYTPGPDGWPSELVAGFALQMFDRNDPAHAARMEAEAASAGLRDHPVFAAPYVARLTLSRHPHAPLALPVVLGPPRTQGVGRLTAESADALPLTLCRAPAVRLSDF